MSECQSQSQCQNEQKNKKRTSMQKKKISLEPCVTTTIKEFKKHYQLSGNLFQNSSSATQVKVVMKISYNLKIE